MGKKSDSDTGLFVCVNRTPVTGEIDAARDKRDINAFGCGLSHTIAQAPKEAQFGIRLNLTTPYMPITSDGKEPNLEPFLNEIASAVSEGGQEGAPPDYHKRQFTEGRGPRQPGSGHCRSQRRW